MSRFFLFCVCFFTITLAQAESACQQHHCLAVVDAGSSGSRLHIFTYDLDTNQNPTDIHELWSKKMKPGFASIELNQETITAYLTQLFANAPESAMPVYFYATAGMRLLPGPKQRKYYQALRQWFDTQPDWLLQDAKTITGKEEGVFGWLAVNYQLGNFEKSDTPLSGVMDMGGASVQVTFPVENTQHIAPENLANVVIKGQSLALFVRSFLGLGQTVLSQQFLNDESCFPIGYPLPDGALGHGNAFSCQRNVSKLVNHVHETQTIVKLAVTENNPSSWYAIGGLAALGEDKLFSFTNNQLTSQELVQQANDKICHQSWDSLNASHPNHDYLYGYCLFAAYYYALITSGYGLTPQQTIHYLPTTKTADWSLGVVLQQKA